MDAPLAVAWLAAFSPGLLIIVVAALVVPLLIVVPAHFRGRARERAGKPPGWDGAGWNLFHVWLAFAWLIIAQLGVLQFLQPGLMDGMLSGQPAHFDYAAKRGITGDDLIWIMAALASCLFVIIPVVPLRLLWTTKWSVVRALGFAWLAFVALRLSIVVLVPSLPDLTSGDHPQRELTEAITSIRNERSLWLMALIVAVVVPVVEEVLFRGVLLTALARRISFAWANTIQAALFATLHLASPLWPFFFAMGATAGWMTRASGGLLPAITLHMLNNASAVALLWWLESSGAAA